MTSRKLDEVATDIADKLDELHDALEHASDTLDDIENSDEIDDKDGGS
jgi:uncharacterized membrane protein